MKNEDKRVARTEPSRYWTTYDKLLYLQEDVVRVTLHVTHFVSTAHK